MLCSDCILDANQRYRVQTCFPPKGGGVLAILSNALSFLVSIQTPKTP